ncbi:hypothetical protein BJ123_13022 [Rhodopseudomonas thermotolerans]|uniref:Uncharacterized protein n=2 Tax=Rhodopseudomonas TaxID=1073 RepID=A0A336JTN3_9BRAD|nr:MULTISPECIES: hypothetical protein [Rhodopseudomonas]RED25789.1 hypothetical protein BJ125_13022 [Rhodopseudomonas pentothenatexigens]REF90418.1 hypothetical protein BJ123_13022 [Rhodopseudomonas thermotolerans]SSW93117.1 hypothetical protein SAMN05892882_13022 [Rhodopseudomonas pentothenatexigens]
MTSALRIDDLEFTYDDDLSSYASYVAGIDIVVQPLRDGFAAEIIDGVDVYQLGTFPSDRWAKVAALQAAMKFVEP